MTRPIFTDNDGCARAIMSCRTQPVMVGNHLDVIQGNAIYTAEMQLYETTMTNLCTFERGGKKYAALVRKLTERECYRLMGVEDQDIDKLLAAPIARTEHYKLAGNSIVVDVLYNLFRKLFIQPGNESAQMSLFDTEDMTEPFERYDHEHPLRVVTLCSGYDSQCLALERLKRDFPPFDYELVAWSEFDPVSKTPLVVHPQGLSDILPGFKARCNYEAAVMVIYEL